MNELEELKPELVDDVQARFLKEDERGKFYIVGRKGKLSFLRVHQVGRDIMEMFDGSRSVAEMKKILEQRGVEVDLDRFISLLGAEGLLRNFQPKKQKEKGKLRVWYFPLIRRTDRILNKVYDFVSVFFRNEIILLLTAFNIAVLSVFVIESISGRVDLRNLFLFGSPNFLLTIACLFLTTPFLAFIHEMAHAATCFHYGGKPGEMGIALYLFLPFFYVDTSDTWMLREKQGVMVFLAGPLLTFSIGSACFLLYYFLPPLVHTFLLIMVFWSYLATFIGFNPTLETDGYYILQSILKFPNLISHVWNYTFSWLKHRLGFHSKEEYEDYISTYSKQEKRILAIFAPFVLFVNALLTCIMGLWGFYLIGEYYSFTYLIIDAFPDVSASIIVTWLIQSAFIASLFIIFPYTIIKRVIKA